MMTATYDGAPLFCPGDASLPVVSGTVTVELDSSGSCDFELAPGHPLLGAIELKSAEHEVRVERGGSEVFRGRVLSDGSGIGAVGRYSCEGQLAYLNDSLLRPYGTCAQEGWAYVAPGRANDLARWYVARHNAVSDGCKRFAVGRCELGNSPVTASSAQWPRTSSELAEKILVPHRSHVLARSEGTARVLDVFGDEDGYGRCSQAVELGENLLDFARTRDASDAVTCIIPAATAGGEDLGIGGLPDGEHPWGYKQGDRMVSGLASEYGIVEERRTYDASTPEGLFSAASADMGALSCMVETIECRAADMSIVGRGEAMRVGQYVRVVSPPNGFDAWMMLVRAVYSWSDPSRDEYVFGSTRRTLVGSQTRSSRSMAAQIGDLQTAVPAISAEAREAAARADAAVIAAYDEYATSDSAAVAPDTGWSTDTPEWEDGSYIWRRPVTAYGDGTSEVGTPACMTGSPGTPGEDATVLRIDSSRGVSFLNSEIATVMTVTVIKGGLQMTDISALRSEYGVGACLRWRWKGVDDEVFSAISADDARLSDDGFTFEVSPADVDRKAVFQCSLDLPDN